MQIKRAKIVLWFVFAVLTALVLVQFKIAVFNNHKYSQRVALQRKTSISVKRNRGVFFDRNMIPLVESSVQKVNIPTGDEDEQISIPSLARYSSSPLASHIIGYTDSDGVGVSGLEKCFENVLGGGKIQKLNAVTDASGKIVKSAGTSITDIGTDKAQNIKLTLDCHIQSIAQNHLAQSGSKGAVVVMDVKNSDILAMASYPDFSCSNVESYLNSSNGELVNRCISEFNAGSIFKIVTLAATLESNSLLPSYTCKGKSVFGGREFACHQITGHGEQNYETAFANSCNCAFYNMGLDVGGDKILQMARSFGFGLEVLCFDGLGEKSGNIPSKDNPQMFETINYSIGQGEILITPVQAANMVCIVANDGVANCVNLADSIVDKNGAVKRSLREVAPRRVISRSTALAIQSCMCHAVQNGTATAAKSSMVQIAGKTGTAQTGWYDGDENLVHGWFCGFFPADNPHYAMAVFVENGKSGSHTAVPIFKEIAEEIVNFYPVG